MLNQNFEDQELQCADCNEVFVFSAEDQEFYYQKGYSSPKRCPICRANRKASSSRGGGRSYGGGGGGRGGGGFNKPRYAVICSGCGCETTVPFEPKNDRPVYCSSCYKGNY